MERNAKRRKVAQTQDEFEEAHSVSVDPLQIQVDVEPSTEGIIERMKTELDEAKCELQIVCGHLSKASEDLVASKYGESAFVDNDEKVLYYSGLPSWEILLLLFTYFKAKIDTVSSRSLNPFQQLIMTLMRLRLSLSRQDLGYRFGVHKSTVSCTFCNMIDIT